MADQAIAVDAQPVTTRVGIARSSCERGVGERERRAVARGRRRRIARRAAPRAEIGRDAAAHRSDERADVARCDRDAAAPAGNPPANAAIELDLDAGRRDSRALAGQGGQREVAVEDDPRAVPSRRVRGPVIGIAVAAIRSTRGKRLVGRLRLGRADRDHAFAVDDARG